MIRFSRRAGLAAALGSLAAPRVLRAQAGGGDAGWQPTRPVQLVTGFAPGGGSDSIARTIAEAAAPFVPQPMVVVNRPGAGGALAAEQVARAAPDGHTLLLAGGSESTSLPAHREVPYDPKRSFRAIIRLTRHPHFICARGKGGRFDTMPQVVEAARAAPGRITHGSAGVGSLSHSLFLMLERRGGLEFLHVPYAGGGPVAQALLAGQIDLGVQASDELGGLAASGDIKPLAASAGPEAQAAPASSSGAAFARLRVWMVRAKPARPMFAAMAAPMTPSPMKATRAGGRIGSGEAIVRQLLRKAARTSSSSVSIARWKPGPSA